MKIKTTFLSVLLSGLLLFALRSGADGTDAWTKMVGNSIVPLGDGFGDGGARNLSNKTVDAMTAFNGFLYASSGQNGSGSGNLPAVWRTGDLTHWTNVAPGFVCTDMYMVSNTNGIFLATGNKIAANQGSIWRSPNGTNWFWFSAPASGYNQTNNFLALLGLQGDTLFSGTGNRNGAQVWKRPSNGSAPWTKVLDFNSGFGTSDGPQTNLWTTYLYCPPSATNVMFFGTLGGSNCSLYQSSDGGASWQRNMAAANSFGTNNSEIAAIVEFNSYLYASTANAQGGFLWRTTLTNAVNSDSSNAWEQVIAGGLGTNTNNGELHRMISAYGNIWICLTGPKAQVWRSADGTNWVQSNVNGFASTNNAAGGYQDIAAFTNSAGNAFTVWGGDWADPSNITNQAAQVWATQIIPAGSPVITNQPQSVSTNIGVIVSFIVGASGNPPMSYQWRMNATNIVNATNAMLALNNVQTNNAGGYDAIISNGVGSVTSLVAMLSVSPVISASVPLSGGMVGTSYSQTLSASAGAPPYTWLLVGGALPCGLALSSAGQIGGTPRVCGTFNFTAQITDAIGQVATGAFGIVVTDPWSQYVGNSIVPLGDGFGAGGVLNTNNTTIQSLSAYNGYLYAAVETVSNQPTIWRSSDLINWTNVVPHFFVNMRNVFDMQSNSNGIFFGTGYGGSPTGAQVWKSTNGVNWSPFSTAASGFYETNSQVMVSLQGSRLYASIMAPVTNSAAEVWERPADGSANWAKVLDFNTGLGSADGVLPNVGYSFLYAPPGATNAVFLPCNNGAITNCWIYETADGGATWHKNVAAGTGFGDTKNAYITAIIEFNGYLYVGTGNPAEGAQIWRKPLADAIDWTSTNAWRQVASGGLVNKSNGEFHRFAIGYGSLWTYLSASGPKAQVWRSDDGTNWVQSNVNGFGTADNSFVGSLAAFTNTSGTACMVCGAEWINATNSRITASQVWASQMFQQNGYAAWAAAITNGLTNYSQSATDDGYPNLLKYATGSSPTNSDALAKINGTLTTNGDFVLNFNRNSNASDITLIAEGSNNATNDATWNGIATNLAGSWGGASNVTETGTGTPVSVTVRDNVAVATNRFLRLRVTRP